MPNGPNSLLEPTYRGYVATTHDALLLFEACLGGVLSHVPRRPHDRERSHLVRSGCVFIYEENSSGIKRWTDGVTWSPSRILGNFLVYRELDKPFPPGEKKRAAKKPTRRPVPHGRPGEPYSNGGYSPGGYTEDRAHSEIERALVGSLVDSYGFKEDGLVKKTMSVCVSGVTHHLVSYYNMKEVTDGHLAPPSTMDHLRTLRPRAELTQKQSFRAPIDEQEHLTIELSNGPAHAYYNNFRAPIVTGPAFTMAGPAPPDYYAGPHFTPVSQHPLQPNAVPPYPLASTQQGYLPTPTAPAHLPHPQSQPQQLKHEDYNQFRGSGSFTPNFDGFNHNGLSSMPPAMHLSGPLPDRARSQSDQSLYRNSSMSARSMTTDMTSPLDPASPASFSRGPNFNLAGQMDGATHSPLEQRGMSFDAAVPRRESHQVPPTYYGNDRPQYYISNPGSATHPNYNGPWQTPPAQQQM